MHFYVIRSTHGIGLAKVHHKLHYLPCTPLGNSLKAPAMTCILAEKKAILSHRRLGHPSYQLHKVMYPHFFQELSIDKLICEAGQLSKLRRSSYPLENNRCSAPFQLIHCDMWGPSPDIYVNGFRLFLISVDDHSRFVGYICLNKK